MENNYKINTATYSTGNKISKTDWGNSSFLIISGRVNIFNLLHDKIKIFLGKTS